MTNQFKRASEPIGGAQLFWRRKFCGSHWVIRSILASLIIFTALILALWPQIRAHLQAIAVLRQLSGTPAPSCLQFLAAEPVTAHSFMLHGSQDAAPAILYVPDHHPNAPGIVILHGVHYLGMTDPRMVNLARAISACGLRVLTPALPGMQDYHVTPSAITRIGDAANWMAKTTGHPVGMMGISFSGGLALMAAAEPQYADHVSFVFTLGAHDSMSRVAQFYDAGEDTFPDGTIEHLAPHEYGPQVLEYEHLEDFTDPADTKIVSAALRAHLTENFAMERTLIAGMTAAQQKEYLRVTHPRLNPQNLDSPLADSSRKHAAEFDAVSPHGHLQGLRARVLVLHGRADNIIPYAESEWLQRDLPAGTLQAILVSPVVSHVNTETAYVPSLMDEWRLVHLMAQVMEDAERAPTPTKISAQ